MSLTDIVSAADLTIFPKIGLVLFLAAFIALMVRTFVRYGPARAGAAAAMPLEDDDAAAPSSDHTP